MWLPRGKGPAPTRLESLFGMQAVLTQDGLGVRGVSSEPRPPLHAWQFSAFRCAAEQATSRTKTPPKYSVFEDWWLCDLKNLHSGYIPSVTKGVPRHNSVGSRQGVDRMPSRPRVGHYDGRLLPQSFALTAV